MKTPVSPSTHIQKLPTLSDITQTIDKEGEINELSAKQIAELQSKRVALYEQRRPFDLLCQGRLNKIAEVKRLEATVSSYEERDRLFKANVETCLMADGGFQDSWRGIMNDPSLFHAERVGALAKNVLHELQAQLKALDDELKQFAHDTGLEDELPSELRDNSNLPA